MTYPKPQLICFLYPQSLCLNGKKIQTSEFLFKQYIPTRLHLVLSCVPVMKRICENRRVDRAE